MCRPGHGPSRHPFTGGHIGPPLHNAGNVPEITESGVENEHVPNGAGRSPPPTGGAEQSGLRRGAPRVWLPPAKFRNGIWGVSHGHPALRKQRWQCTADGPPSRRPLRKTRRAPSTTRDSGVDGRIGWESEQRSSPKCPSTSGNPSVTAAPCQLPLHKGAFPCGGRGMRIAVSLCSSQ